MERQDAIYARQSIDKIDSISIESQIEYCSYETKGEDYKVFYDKGYSGKNTDRPQFQEMLNEIRDGKIKRVICYKLDRISRSILDFSSMIEEFQKYGVEFVSTTEKFDTSTPMGRAMLNICIVFSQLERETIQQRVTDSYISRSRKGFYMGGRVPYGYRRENFFLHGKKTSHYIIEQEEAHIVTLIYEMFSNPKTSYGDIIRYLMKNNIKNNQCKDGYWSRSRIAEMIKNPIYVRADEKIYEFFKSNNAKIHNSHEEFNGINGIYLYSENKSGHKILRLQESHIVIAPHIGIVSSDIWLKTITKCFNNKQIAKSNTGKNSWLIGKIKCGKCGYALTVKTSTERRYLVCSHRIQTSACEGVRGIRADNVEIYVLTKIKHRIMETKNCPAESYSKIIKTITNWNSSSFDDKRQTSDFFLNTVKITEDCIDIDWKI